MSNHCHRITDLPWHHRDPFDRPLVSQAQAIPAYLLTTDELLAKYSDLVTCGCVEVSKTTLTYLIPRLLHYAGCTSSPFFLKDTGTVLIS